MFKKLEDERRGFLGATGEHPEGKINDSDEGELRFAIGHENGKVIMQFGKPTAWVGMDAKQAVALASSLLEHARRVSDDVLTLKI